MKFKKWRGKQVLKDKSNNWAGAFWESRQSLIERTGAGQKHLIRA